MLLLGHQILRQTEAFEAHFQPEIHSFHGQRWTGGARLLWGIIPLDIMVGDRRSDMGAGWAFGARLYRVHADVGLQAIGTRWMDEQDRGDAFRP